ncbi:MAG TPA: DUF4263 domain-containing protein [bacterium]|nr:DUF4263 domain-containing protein [bacterium]
MKIEKIQTSQSGIGHLEKILKNGIRVFTKAVFWKIPHKTSKEDISLKIGRYNKPSGTVETETPRSELTLDNEEFQNLLKFISENYAPLKDGVKNYIAIDDPQLANSLKVLFGNDDKKRVLNFIIKNNIVPNDIVNGIRFQEKKKAISEFEEKLKDDHVEGVWQKWFSENSWVLGSEFVEVLGDRDIDTDNISDYLMEAYDGFLDIIEIKRPGGDLQFWFSHRDHDNLVPHSDLVKAITQTANYIYEVEREANSIKFLERTGHVPVVKPRAVLIYGRSKDWGADQKRAYRILNSSYHNITILTYDHVLARAKRILETSQAIQKDTDQDGDIAF